LAGQQLVVNPRRLLRLSRFSACGFALAEWFFRARSRKRKY